MVRSRTPRSGFPPKQPERADKNCIDDAFNKVTAVKAIIVGHDWSQSSVLLAPMPPQLKAGWNTIKVRISAPRKPSNTPPNDHRPHATDLGRFLDPWLAFFFENFVLNYF
jgi:hypothetical protein